jgi:LAS superfamily LD-carboxypeptidase LdcB
LKTLAIPGHSEHQTGLAVDFVQGTRTLTTDFEKTSSFAWLSQNAHEFGFILRYPSDKVEITGYDYEPWHFRFVGRTVASRIYEANICYEEYVALTN